MDYLLLFVGLGLLLLGANYLVDSSVAIAQRAKISNFIIGLTIVGMGTSAPELFVSVSSALAGSGDLAIGNVLGSNICNILLILGITAVIYPFPIEQQQRRRDIPFLIAISLLLLCLANDRMMPGITQNSVSRVDGILFLVIFFAYMCWVILQKGKNPQQALQEADEETKSSLAGRNVWLLCGIAVLSLGALIFGGNLFLESAKNLARSWGMSEAVIAITIVAVGTSLPELITAVIAAVKHNPQLALGNVVGSNIFNILFILGVSATCRPLNIIDINVADYIMVLASAVMLYLIVLTFKRNKFDRIEGFIFLAVYVAYTIYLLMR